MPFNFLKKSRHYNVTSKSLFVISVHHLLDTSTTVDCTLSSESTGHECLDNVCQRLSINQPELFGLRYILKGSNEERWVDLERPLSRQLEKYASGSKLYLKVQYYIISGVSLLEDEQSRYYYFLQLKCDIGEGKLLCDSKQAVLLALYCRQAEYDSYQKDKNSLEYLKTLLPFPQRLIDEGLQENLIEEILQHNPGLLNLTQSAAEEWFITVCQQIDGYGQEKFWVKDNQGNEVQLGLSINGIAVIGPKNIKFYPWHEVKNVINLKKTFNIEQDGKNVVSFTFPEADTGRYFWRLCVLQHLFYSKHEVNKTSTHHQSFSSNPGNIYSQQTAETSGSNQQIVNNAAQSTSKFFHNYSAEYNDSQEDLLNEHLYYTGNKVSDHQPLDHKNSLISSNLSLSNSQYLSQQQQQQQNSQHQTLQHTSSNTSSNLGNRSNQSFQPAQNRHYNQGNLSNRTINLSNSQILDSGIQSTSCLDLSNNNFVSNDKERLKALLPTYRPAPDYETALQQKYRASSNEIQMIRVPSAAHLYSSGSQPDVNNSQISQQQRFPDIVAQNVVHSVQLPPTHVNTNLYSNIDLLQRLQMMRLKPPPPYTANRLSSTSTPDLAVAASLRTTPLGYRGNSMVSGSSPDLVSTRTFLNTQYPNQIQYSYLNQMGHSQPYLTGTYDNLNMIEEQPHAIFIQMKKPTLAATFDQGTTHIFHHPKGNFTQQQQQNEIVTPNSISHKTNINGSIEPIYENVPFPYNNSNNAINNNSKKSINISNAIRNRTSSIQSAPSGTQGIIEAKNPNVLGNVNEVNQQLNDLTLNISQNHTNKDDNSSGYMLRNNHENEKMNPKPSQNQIYGNHQHHNQNYNETSDISEVNNSNSVENSSFASQYHSISAPSIALNSSTISTSTAKNTDLSNVSGNTNTKEKRKKRWGILTGKSHKNPNNSSEKKSATLGREKAKNKIKEELLQDDTLLHHRWSTGLPRLQPISASFSKDKLSQILSTKLNDSQLYIEYESIPKRRDKAKYDCALMEENKLKNCDPMFLPYDDNRIRITPTMENRLGYVNASYISATVGANQRFYIIGQSPFNNSSTQFFWQCVWEADVYFIVQLSDELHYIPTTTHKPIECGQFQIYQEFSQVTNQWITSKLRIYHQQTKRQRSVWHLNYSDWAEQNCPRNTNMFLNFLEEISSVRLASINEVPPGHNSNPPVFIHCRDGVGRSGVTLISDLLLYTLDHNQDLDIPRVVGQLRQQRDSLIPSLAQYKFIYALLINYLERTRLI